MRMYKFVFNEKEYELREDNCDYFANDEEHPVSGIELEDILQLLNESEEVDFDIEHYAQHCENCMSGKEERSKSFKFLEYHFYIFTKKGGYVISTISKEYVDMTFNRLLKQGKVDNSYIVSVIVCEKCGSYSVEIEQCEV
jgi:hypothetical protein